MPPRVTYPQGRELFKSASDWLADWYGHPSTVEKMQANLQPEEIEDIQSRIEKLQKLKMRPSVPYIESGLKNLYTAFFGRANDMHPTHHLNRAGKTLRHGTPTLIPQGVKGSHSPTFGDITMAARQSPESYESIAAHEAEHYANRFPILEFKRLDEKFGREAQYTRGVPMTMPFVHGINTRYMGGSLDASDKRYITSPNEIRSRIMQLRKILDIEPGEKVTEDKLQFLKDNYSPKKPKEDKVDWQTRLYEDYEEKTGKDPASIAPYFDLKARGDYDDKDILWFLNNLVHDSNLEESQDRYV
tara:strand:- start:1419 stop:2321 length:903 start_codon:yes stop_codon:yes gene_type:complete